jgi:hypothetical protein
LLGLIKRLIYQLVGWLIGCSSHNPNTILQWSNFIALPIRVANVLKRECCTVETRLTSKHHCKGVWTWVRYLVEQCGADVHVKDLHQYTALDNFTDDATVPICCVPATEHGAQAQDVRAVDLE